MNRLFQAYRAVHEQGFLPIFVEDDFDSMALLEGCIKAGMTAIEYTLRRRDADRMIPWIRRHHPDLYLLVGSTVDDEKIVARQKRRFPQLLTVAELDAMGVDGFVSMLGWTRESIERYSSTRILMPFAGTRNEAFYQVAWAHFAKMFGKALDVVKECRMSAAFDFCPIIVTGGMTPDRIPDAMQVGAVMVATGFDLTLKGEDARVSSRKVADVMRRYLEATRLARERSWPQLAAAADADDRTWLDALPHYHPF
jgi:2-keto-3-deoxy-6-phosphogluconate aldolase